MGPHYKSNSLAMKQLKALQINCIFFPVHMMVAMLACGFVAGVFIHQVIALLPWWLAMVVGNGGNWRLVMLKFVV